MGRSAAVPALAQKPGEHRADHIKLCFRSEKRIPLLNVIIPVFLGLRETQRCIESVLAARCSTPHEVIVIDDASPDAGLSEWLRNVERSGRIRLIVHPANRGFVASCNEGMRLDPARDVLLLNSDTEVADGWLDRLAACAARGHKVATVTPFSSNATICSYPSANQSNPLPAGTTTAELDRLFAAVNAGESVAIPTAVGFCMLIRRECLDEVGDFDEEAFGRGYGEEVDFCMRAARAGYQHLLCADTFVFHEGEVSFRASGHDRRQAAQKLVDERYPEFQPLVRQFIHVDPARPLRRAVDVARLQGSKRPRILFVSHQWGGGVEKHVEALAKLLERDREVLLLQPTGGGNLSLRWLREGEEFRAWFDGAGISPVLLELLRSLAVSRVHFHHVHGLQRAILGLAQELAVPYDVTLHDYVAYCPQYHLADERGRYCGEPDEDGCRACVARRPAQWDLDIADWRRVFGEFLHRAQRVIAPSHDLAGRMRARFPGLALTELPHFEGTPAPAAAPSFRIAVLGGLSAIKGLDVLEACSRDAMRRGLPLHFRVIGYIGRDIAQWPDAPLSVTGSYPDEHLDELLALERADAVLFLSQVPESYSYTLTVAMRSGLPILAPDLGAFPERLGGHRGATLFAWNLQPAALNDTLLARLQPAALAATGD
jgi:GT2 family glycosyltransferase/glycosyltransferase involved in cell wall biosynthesis